MLFEHIKTSGIAHVACLLGNKAQLPHAKRQQKLPCQRLDH